MALPKKKLPRDASLKDAFILLYGEPGTGKTTLACASGEALLMHTPSAGHKVVEAYKYPVHTLDDFRDGFSELLKGHSYSAVVIDMLADLITMCEGEVVEEYNAKAREKVKTVAEIPHGRGYATLKHKVMRIMNSLQRLKCPVVFTAHTRKEEIKSTIPRTVVVPEFSPSLREKILGMCDLVGLVGINKDGTREVQIAPTRDSYGKNRLSSDKLIPATWSAFEGLEKTA